MIRFFRESEWPTEAANFVQQVIAVRLEEERSDSVMLTGGKSAERLYVVWRQLPELRATRSARCYFGDERCVPPGHPHSNYELEVK